MKDLTVLDDDPYRCDTPANHRKGEWFAAQVARFVPGSGTVHLRGLHYLVASATDVRKPDGQLYVNSTADWDWLSGPVADAGRWLKYVPFARITDARNEEADIYIPDYDPPGAFLLTGGKVELPAARELMPHFYGHFQAQQPYRIVLITEKSSLRPVAESVGGELLSMTDDASHTRIAEFAKRAAEDGRPCVVLYFSDHDPSGHGMPISVSRKLQALRDLLHPGLEIQVRRAALTVEQANALDLPMTPLKEKERRAANWRARTGREQTEIDALIALRPDALRRLAWKAVEPFFDATLRLRVPDASAEWHAAAKGTLASHPEYHAFAERIEAAQAALERAAEACNALAQQAHKALWKVKPPPLNVPEPELPAQDGIGAPVFTTDDGFIAATLWLKEQKALIL